MSVLARRGGASLIPDVFDLFDAAWPFTTRHPMHIEEYVDGTTYVVRAELPGMNPDKDIVVSAADGHLTIAAERQQTTRDTQRSEFRYGSFERSILLPAGADATKVDAKYDNGILEVRVPMRKPAEEHRVRIAVNGKAEKK
ncbi:Hsp20/alpha crystallin family protein [Kibdelosporangium lantanae]|uniref:Hsp20/alpha crystallin family protein n=1 Tax=Kibdelosporangium lantanae TaxID=1497396 RepID=A0ABW3MIH7_9PSEU